MSVVVAPDAEAITGRFLRADTDMIALVGDRVGGRTPTKTADAWVRITQITDDVRFSKSLHLACVHLQIECYAGNDRDHGQAEASLLARTTRAVLNTMPGQDLDGPVVSSVVFGGISRVPDTSLDTARERYTFDAWVWLHA